ncbi:MAG TPA: Tim44/TimA family putative adaptor protein [Kiloniellales bacterium]|jgi:predicted lipid-binding transport protein (Tim44 family)|nr:Tim44/TimA family putative adaptor protein [Kiloniellales bacterium]
MNEGSQLLDILLFAAIAAFLVLRLRNVLGRRTGHDSRPEFDPFKQKQEAPQRSAPEDEKIIPLPSHTRRTQEANFDGNDPVSAGITQIRLADGNFDPEAFLKGAHAAFEMIVSAFAKGDKDTLRNLLADDVYNDFSRAIDERQEEGHRLETTLVSIHEPEIIEAELQDRTAFVTVKLVSEQINVTRDSENRIIEGDPSDVVRLTDIWTFARNTRSRDPNWALVATSSPN